MYINRLEADQKLGPLLGNVVVEADGLTLNHDLKRVVHVPDSHFVYVEVPKVACTSIKHCLGNAYDVPKEEIYKWTRGLLCWSDMRQVKELGYFVFSIVRNPFDRLVSAYESKINLDPAEEDARPLVLAAREALKVEHVSFADFVELVIGLPDEYANIHWRSQHLFVCDASGKPYPHYVGRFEKLQDEMKTVSQFIGKPLELEAHGMSKREKDYRSYYTPQLKDKVAKHYAKDLKIFEYSF